MLDELSLENDDPKLQRGRQDGDTEAPVILVDPSAAEENGSVLPFPIVAIGASAGGLEAFTDLLRSTPVDTGMAFVILSHLPPHRVSLLSEILGRTTLMPVVEITAGMPPEPNRVHVIPPNMRMTLHDGKFHLEPRPERDPLPRPIDLFFSSLAIEQKSRCIGVVLSGSDSDGSLGLKVIKGEGGISIVQDERTARFEEMPRSAIAADPVDLILPPSEIGQELGRIAQGLRDIEQNVPEQPVEDATEKQILKRIYSQVRSISGVDFDRYKQSTLRRRIARRMVMKRIATIGEYCLLLQSQPAEVRELYEDALIGVTRFFRDPDVFDAMKADIFPLLLKGRPVETPIRIWVAGCATGEEVYSITICLLEYLGSLPVQTPIQIFGTDVSERSIDRARLAVYPESIVGEVSPERLQRYFTKLEKGYQVNKRIRELCIFAKQNLMQDPPFSRIDLVSCRNVLIYFGPAAQRRVISAFHYALNYPGALLLGQSETIREFANLFAWTDRRSKFYSKNPVSNQIHSETNGFTQLPEFSRPGRIRDSVEDSSSDFDLQRVADRLVVARHGPPGVVVNDRMELLQSRGDTSPYLMLPTGILTFNILRMAKEGLGPALRDGLQRAISGEAPVVIEGVLMQTPNRFALTLEIFPIQNPADENHRFLVLFVPNTEPGAMALAPTYSVLQGEERDAEIVKLRQDTASTKLYLQSLIEERDSKNQELISANEEIQSSNEELQSINEELETAKEELQSSNEELQTVNEELHRKNQQLTLSSNDLTNLLNNITMPVLILGTGLEIRQFTPLAERVLSVRSADVGRHIREVRLNLKIDDIAPLVQDVIDNLATRELEVEDLQGHWHLLRARPYRTVDNKIDGAVIVLIDIGQIRATQQELRSAHAYAQAVIEGVQVPLVVLNDDLRIRLVNPAFAELSQLSPDKIDNRLFSELANALWEPSNIQERLLNVRDSDLERGVFSFEHSFDQGRKTLLIQAHVIKPERTRGVLIAIEDISSRKQAQQLLRREALRLESQVLTTEVALKRSHEELQRLTGSLFAAQEEERRRVAQDLHDDLGQKVALLEMQVEQMGKLSKDGNLNADLAEIRRKTSELAEGLRRVAHGLHPQILDDLGLPAALQRLVEEFEAAEDMPVRFVVKSMRDNLPRPVTACCYRIVQEALFNISKHAGNTPVGVTVECSGDQLSLSISDEGVGFDVAQARLGEGLGLIGLHERARLLGGSCLITSQLGHGTRIELILPLSECD